MSFHEIRFPVEIGYQSRGGPGFATSVIETEAGHEQRVARWENPRRRYNALYGAKKVEDVRLLAKFYLARKGSLNGFRFKDWFDFTSNADGASAHAQDDQLLYTGDGTTTVIQIIKSYTSGSQTVVRNINKPVSSTVLVEVDGVLQTVTTDYTIDTATGLITFVVAPPIGDEVKAGYEFDVPVRFDKSADTLLQASFDAFDVASIADVPLVEILDPRPSPDEWWYGGASAWTTSAVVNPVMISQGRMQLVEVIDATHNLRLPVRDNLPLGGPYFYLKNTGALGSDIEDELGGVLSSFPAGSDRVVLLGPSAWIVV